MTNETITTIANLALPLSFIVALIFGIAQVKCNSHYLIGQRGIFCFIGLGYS